MQKKYFPLSLVIIIAALLVSVTPARADWPSAEDVLKKVGPLAGLNPDQIEFTIFALKEPDCASTIVSYTIAQDYSLVVFIGGLKAAKLESIPKIPKMSHGQCKAYNPMEQAYIAIDTLGEKFVSKAGPLKGTIKGYIEEGKGELDSQIASIPYVGTVLQNWDCGCDAAYMTNLQSEKVINQKVSDVIAIGGAVKAGDIPGALERLITSLGPEVACELGAQWTGVGAIPVVSDVAAKACSSVAGKAVEWVVDGASVTAEALGIIGGEHIPPEDYYQKMFAPEVAKEGYPELADILYDKCYKYFEASNMAASTAKKVCVGFRNRYIEESIYAQQWKEFQNERNNYYTQQVKPKAIQAAMVSDVDFQTIKGEVKTTCINYFTQKYPKLVNGADKPIEEICTSFVSYNKSSYHPWDMDKARNQAQISITNEVVNKHQPFCKKDGVRNSIACTDQAIKACFDDLQGVCTKSKTELGGMEKPCCRLGSGTDSVFEYNSDWADTVAKKQAPFCKTKDSDPLVVTCALQNSFDACVKTTTAKGFVAKTCDTVEKNPNGTAKEVCCQLDKAWLSSVPGVNEIKGFVMGANIKNQGTCGVGGMQAGYGYDPRIANCSSGKPLESCQKKFPNTCKKLESGYVDGPCCDLAVFGSTDDTADRPYSPDDRNADDLALTEKVIKESNGQCHYGSAGNRKVDKFKVVCDTVTGGKICTTILDRYAKTPCSAKMSGSGWVTAPCCEISTKAREADINDAQLDKNIKVPTAQDANNAKNHLGMVDDGDELSTRKMGTVKRDAAPTGDKTVPKTLGQKSLGSMNTRATPDGRISGSSPSPHGEPDAGRAAPTARTSSERGLSRDTTGTPTRRATPDAEEPVEENYKP